MIIFEQIGLMTLVGGAVIWDIRTWRIPNWLVLLVMETGIFFSVKRDGWMQGIVSSGTGIAIPIGLLFFMFAVGFLGAGDIKLLSAVGAFVGMQIGRIILYAFLAGGLLSVLYVGKHWILPRIIGRKGMKSNGKNRIHFSLAILIGCLVYFFPIG